MVRTFAHGSMGRRIIPLRWNHWDISRSSQCRRTGVTKAVVCVILSVREREREFSRNNCQWSEEISPYHIHSFRMAHTFGDTKLDMDHFLDYLFCPHIQ